MEINTDYTKMSDVAAMHSNNAYVHMLNFGKKRTLSFENPSVIYTPENVQKLFAGSGPYKYKTNKGLNTINNSISLVEGMELNIGEGYKIKITDRNCELIMPENAEYASITLNKRRIAAGMDMLIRKANGQVGHDQYQAQFENYSSYIVKGLKSTGLNMDKIFSINDKKFKIGSYGELLMIR